MKKFVFVKGLLGSNYVVNGKKYSVKRIGKEGKGLSVRYDNRGVWVMVEGIRHDIFKIPVCGGAYSSLTLGAGIREVFTDISNSIDTERVKLYRCKDGSYLVICGNVFGISK